MCPPHTIHLDIPWISMYKTTFAKFCDEIVDISNTITYYKLLNPAIYLSMPDRALSRVLVLQMRVLLDSKWDTHV